jgi:hypothetical protein
MTHAPWARGAPAPSSPADVSSSSSPASSASSAAAVAKVRVLLPARKAAHTVDTSVSAIPAASVVPEAAPSRWPSTLHSKSRGSDCSAEKPRYMV